MNEKKTYWYKNWKILLSITGVLVVSLAIILPALALYNHSLKPKTSSDVYTIHTNKLDEYVQKEDNFYITTEDFGGKSGAYEIEHGSILIDENGEIVQTNANNNQNGAYVDGTGQENFYYDENGNLLGVTEINENKEIQLTNIQTGESVTSNKVRALEVPGEFNYHHEYGFASGAGVYYALLSDDDVLMNEYNSANLDTEGIYLQPTNYDTSSTDYYFINLYEVVWGFESVEEVSKLTYDNGRYKNTTDNDLFHANAIDYNVEKDEMYVSVRNMNMIVCISLFDDVTGEYNPETLWILNGTPITYYYYCPGEDPNEATPHDEGALVHDTISYNYNENYQPHMYPYWEDLSLTYVVNGVEYDTPQEIWTMDESYKFAGQHYVRSLNNLLETVGYENYNPDNTYISIFDNHENPETNLYDKLSDYYSGKTYQDTGIEIDLNLEENTNSYVKVFEIDTTDMTATLLVNEPVDKAEIRSNGLFFAGYNETTQEYDKFLLVGSDYTLEHYSPTIQIFTFDHIENGRLVDENGDPAEIIFDLQFEDIVHYLYRAQPVWKDMSNIVVGAEIQY